MAKNHKSQTTNHKQITNHKLQTTVNKTWKNYHRALEEFKFNEALISIWDLIGFCDRYIEKERPWEKSAKQQAAINNLLLVVDNIAEMTAPFLPQTSQRILEQLQTKKSEPLFPRKTSKL